MLGRSRHGATSQRWVCRCRVIDTSKGGRIGYCGMNAALTFLLVAVLVVAFERQGPRRPISLFFPAQLHAQFSIFGFEFGKAPM